MAGRSWTIELDGTRHTIDVSHGYWSGKRAIQVNGDAVHRSRKFWDTGSEHRFDVNGHPCVLKIRNSLFHFEYELFVDGKIV